MRAGFGRQPACAYGSVLLARAAVSLQPDLRLASSDPTSKRTGEGATQSRLPVGGDGVAERICRRFADRYRYPGCLHLPSTKPEGIDIQTYMAIIACMLISLWTGRKPTLRTYEMICYYFRWLGRGRGTACAHREIKTPRMIAHGLRPSTRVVRCRADALVLIADR